MRTLEGMTQGWGQMHLRILEYQSLCINQHYGCNKQPQIRNGYNTQDSLSLCYRDHRWGPAPTTSHSRTQASETALFSSRSRGKDQESG